MTNRSLILASIVTLEVLIVAGMVAAIRGGNVAKWLAPPGQAAISGRNHLVEGGPHQTFDAGTHPSLNVDIGYADLTIRAGDPGQFDVSLSKGRTLSLGPAAAITVRQSGETLNIEKPRGDILTTGDFRRVTVLVPPGTHVDVAEAGDIQVYGLHGETSLKSVGSGKIRVEDFDGPALHVETSNGRILLSRVSTTHIDATANNDRFEGSALQLHDGTIESDGRAVLGFAPGADTLVSADGSSGNVRKVKIGAGSGRLDVHAGEGDVAIQQEN